MATIEGNEIALRNVAKELIPPSRNGQPATVNQDDAGPPFISRSVALTGDYVPQDPSRNAPSWVYGLCVDSISVDNGQVFVAFGTAEKSVETLAIVGQVILIPRGARRVFLRGSVELTATVTWFTDRYADKRYSPKAPTQSISGNVTVINTGANPVPVTTVAPVSVTASTALPVTAPNPLNVNVQSATVLDVNVSNNVTAPVPVSPVGTTQVQLTGTNTITTLTNITNPLGTGVQGQVLSAVGDGGALLDTGGIDTGQLKFWGFAIINFGTSAATWQLSISGAGVIVDSGTVPASSGGAPGLTIIYYGPGINSIPAGSSGHGILLPPSVKMTKLAAGEGIAGQQSQIFWWGRY